MPGLLDYPRRDPAYDYGGLLPIKVLRDTGEFPNTAAVQWGMPEIGWGLIDALTLPGRALQGQPYTMGDVTDMALNVGGMGATGASIGGVPAGAFGANVGGRSAKALPMDEASRMARAREDAALPMDFDNRRYRATADMGFDFDKPVYHLTSKDVGAFQLGADPSSHTGGGAIWLRRNPSTNPAAHQVSSPREVYREGANDVPLVMRRDGELPDNVVAELISNGKLSNDFPLRVSMAENKMLRDLGYKFYEKGNEVAVFDPSHIRSRFAAFDPAKADSADLLAANGPGGAGLLAPALDPRKREAPMGLLSLMRQGAMNGI